MGRNFFKSIGNFASSLVKSKSKSRARSIGRTLRSLRCEPLEPRRLLATFAGSGANLNLTLNTANESVSIVANVNTVTLTDVGATWSGTDSANVVGNGTNTLTITSAGQTNFTTVSIVDAAAGTAV